MVGVNTRLFFLWVITPLCSPKISLKRFSSLMYLISIYAIFVFQEIFKVNHDANLKLRKMSQEKTKYGP